MILRLPIVLGNSMEIPYELQGGSEPPCGSCRKCQRQEVNQETVRAMQTRGKARKEAEQGGNERVEPEWCQSYSLADIQARQRADPDISTMLEWKEQAVNRPDVSQLMWHSPATRNLWLLWDSLV